MPASNLDRAAKQRLASARWRENNPLYAARYRAKHKKEISEKAKIWYGKNRHKKRIKGTPPPPYDAPVVCECCGRPPSTRFLSVDHNHSTGRFRGWLCGPCNTGIGLLGDDIAGVLRAANYLNKADLT